MSWSARRLVVAVEVLAALDVLAAACLAGVSLARSTKAPAGLAQAARSAPAPKPRTSARSSAGPQESSADNSGTGKGRGASTGTTAAPRSSAAPAAPPSSTAAATTTSPKQHAPTSATTAARSAKAEARAKGPKPVLDAIAPSSGSAGQTVTLEGKGFFSADGHITVTFGTKEAPVYCPKETICHATVPNPGGASSVLVTVATETGTSNSLRFSYRALAKPKPPAAPPAPHSKQKPAK